MLLYFDSIVFFRLSLDRTIGIKRWVIVVESRLIDLL